VEKFVSRALIIDYLGNSFVLNRHFFLITIIKDR
jgi:hypothetical protein